MSRPLKIPQDVLERIRALCLALPGVTVRVDESRISARSAWSFDIRRRSFCLLVAVKGRNGKPVPRLVLRVDRHRDRLGVRLTDDTDWEEIRDLIIESYRLLAPKKLTALLD
jgi:hypothetical protein